MKGTCLCLVEVPSLLHKLALLCIQPTIPDLTVCLEFPNITLDSSSNFIQVCNRDLRDDVRGELKIHERFLRSGEIIASGLGEVAQTSAKLGANTWKRREGDDHCNAGMNRGGWCYQLVW